MGRVGLIHFVIVLVLLQHRYIEAKGIKPVDPLATQETVALLQRLHRVSGKKILFGHQNATLQGMGWDIRTSSTTMPDVFVLSGKYPAVVGFDFGNFKDLDHLPYKKFFKSVKKAHHRGAIITFSWHMYNPITGKKPGTEPSFRERVLHRLLPGGDKHQHYIRQLDKIASFAHRAKDRKGKPIPIIFRPFHEQNGDWFWWSFSPPSDYIKLWRFTVGYLRKQKQVHQFLYVYSPSQQFEKRETPSYLYSYPGDQYVDILGLDCYQPHLRLCLPALRHTVVLARRAGKVAALTECGWQKTQQSREYKHFWTKRFLQPIQQDFLARHIAFALFWRNESTQHHYMAYPGSKNHAEHPSSQDFRVMSQHPRIGFVGSQEPNQRKPLQPIHTTPSLMVGDRRGQWHQWTWKINSWLRKKHKQNSLGMTSFSMSSFLHPFDGQQQGAYRNQAGEILQVKFGVSPRKPSNLSKVWQKQQKQNYLEQRAHVYQTLSSPTSWFWTSAGAEFVCYCDPKGQVQLWFLHMGKKVWQHINLSQLTSAPKMKGTPFAFYRSTDHVLHIVTQSQDGPLLAFWLKLSEGVWRIYDIHRKAGTKQYPVGTLSLSIHRHNGSPYLVYRDAAQQVHSLQLKYEPTGTKRWVHSKLTQKASQGIQAYGKLFAFAGQDTTQYVMFRNVSKRLFLVKHHTQTDEKEMLRFPSQLQAEKILFGWQPEGLSSIYLLYLGPGGHLHELRKKRNVWRTRNLSKQLTLPTGIQHFLTAHRSLPSAM